jgi:hypothetical protein
MEHVHATGRLLALDGAKPRGRPEGHAGRNVRNRRDDRRSSTANRCDDHSLRPHAEGRELRVRVASREHELRVGDWSGRDVEFEIATAADAAGGERTLRQVRSPLTVHAEGSAPVRRIVAYTWRAPAERNAVESVNDPVGSGSSGSAQPPLLAFSWHPAGEVDTVTYDTTAWSFSASGAVYTWSDALGRNRTMTAAPPVAPGFAAPPHFVL